MCFTSTRLCVYKVVKIMSAFLHSNIIWLIYTRTLTNLFLKFLHVASVKSALNFVFTVAATASVNDPFSYLVEG